jgi:hypothetical protein
MEVPVTKKNNFLQVHFTSTASLTLMEFYTGQFISGNYRNFLKLRKVANDTCGYNSDCAKKLTANHEQEFNILTT